MKSEINFFSPIRETISGKLERNQVIAETLSERRASNSDGANNVHVKDLS